MSFGDRVAAIVAVATEARAPSTSAWPFASAEPEDLAALYAASDGLALADGTTIFGRATLAETTRWLLEDKELAWPEDLVVIGERDDLIVVRDLDREASRAGGGVLEVPTDALEGFARVAIDVIGYLEARAKLRVRGARAPEIEADLAITARDADALLRIARGEIYPGAELVRARAAMAAAEIAARAGADDEALEAFDVAVASRARAARRGAESIEIERAWLACARTCDDAGRSALAETCRRRALSR